MIANVIAWILQGLLIVNVVVMGICLMLLLLGECIEVLQRWRRGRRGVKSLKDMSILEWNLIERGLREK